MRVKTYRVVNWIWVMILLLEVNFFNIMPVLTYSLSNFNTTFNRSLIVVLTLLAFTSSLYVYKRTLSIKWFQIYYAMLIIFLVLEFANSSIKYGISILDFFIEIHFYFVQLLIFPLVILCKRYGLERFTKTITIIVGIGAFLIGVQAIVYNMGEAFFLGGYYKEFDVLYGRTIRLFASPIIAYLAIYYFVKIMSNYKVNFGDFIILSISLFTIIYVHQTRSNIIAIVLSMAIVVILLKNIGKKKSLLVAALLILFGLLINSSVFDAFWTTFQKGDIRYYSTITRIEELSYFWSQFLKNPVLGVGCIRDSMQNYLTIKYGARLSYYYSDIGLLGDLSRYGISGMTINATLILGTFFNKKDLISNKQTDNSQIVFYRNLKMGLAVYLGLSIMMLAYFESERVILLSIICAVLYVL